MDLFRDEPLVSGGLEAASTSASSVRASEVAAPWAVALLSAACVIGTGLFGAGFWVSRDSGPPAEAFASAAQVIRDGFVDGDLILLVPFYATRAREHLGDLNPIAVRDPLAEDLVAHRRVWVFGLFEEAEKLRDKMVRAGHTLKESRAPSAGITVDLYTVGSPSRVVYSFRDQLRSASVYHEQSDGKRVPCDRWSDVNDQGAKRGRWICPKDSEWFFVAPQWHRMGDHLRLCLWAHPPNSGRLVIAYPDVPMTGVLQGRAGHTLNGSMNARERIDLDVQVGDMSSQRFVFPLQTHWRPFSLIIPSTGTATVTFAVSTPDAGANHFCFDADVRTR